MSQFDYPRPQLRRDAWQSLNGVWDFTFDDERRYRQPGDDIHWDRQIVVPFAPESEASGIADTGFHTVCWYRCRFTLDQRGRSPCLRIRKDLEPWFGAQYAPLRAKTASGVLSRIEMSSQIDQFSM